MELLDLFAVCSGEAGTDGAAGNIAETRYAQVRGGVEAGGDLVHLNKLVAGAGQADFHALGFGEPAVGLGFGDARLEVVKEAGYCRDDRRSPPVVIGAVRSLQWTVLADPDCDLGEVR